ncbi:MAG TPA: NADH:ubiquinone reductase (Na(+)-transporting) subunit A, partial [Gammaproteobacteria bacterium]|nr:NADH:ubiquinone reductase (Na(+)-transporting) subunit A [Gammaproteobacteria bacterium]
AAGREVWHVGYQDVIAIGKLFGTGHLSVERTVALGGAALRRPRLVATRLGAALDDLLQDELVADERAARAWRVVSGSVLCGRTADAESGYLGRYHHQVSAIPQARGGRLFGWLGARAGVRSHLRRFARSRAPGKRAAFTTALNGRYSALVPVDAFERILPLDILPVPLVRALLVGDTDQAQSLGCLELDPEDLALMSFVCPGKNDYGEVLRVNLEQIERWG